MAEHDPSPVSRAHFRRLERLHAGLRRDTARVERLTTPRLERRAQGTLWPDVRRRAPYSTRGGTAWLTGLLGPAPAPEDGHTGAALYARRILRELERDTASWAGAERTTLRREYCRWAARAAGADPTWTARVARATHRDAAAADAPRPPARRPVWEPTPRK